MNNPFNYPEKRFQTAKANNFYCELANGELPENFLNACKEVSDYPVVKVPVRTKGITAGMELRCFWNANVISQTFGGKPINGWLIKHHPKSKHFVLIGHSVWLTPEGKLVDVTKRNSSEKKNLKFRYFLPSDAVIKLGKNRETMKTLHFTEDIDSLKGLTAMNTGDLGYGMKLLFAEINGDKLPKYDEDDGYRFCGEETVNWEKYLNKVIDPHGFPASSSEDNDHFLKFLREKGYTDEVIKNVRKPFIGVVDKNYPKMDKFISGLELHERLINACEMNRNFCELHSDIDQREAWVSKLNERERGYETSVIGISTTNGKRIDEIPPKFELVSQYEIPRKKSKKRKVEKLALQNNLNVQEFLMVSCDYLFPHPYLVKKSNYSLRVM